MICAACVCRGVVEVVALMGSVQRGLCGSSTVRAIVDQVAAAVKDKPHLLRHFFGMNLHCPTHMLKRDFHKIRVIGALNQMMTEGSTVV